MGLVELERYDSDMLVRRKHIFDLYSRLLGGVAECYAQHKIFLLPVYETELKKSSYHVYLLRIANIDVEKRDKIIQYIFNKDVSVNVHFIPVPMLTYYTNNGYNIKDYPKSLNHFSQVISLPVFYDLTDEQIHTIVKAVNDAVNAIINQ
jgi:dTDP-4-amino-4,6-dideoxygalactose transaminase